MKNLNIGGWSILAGLLFAGLVLRFATFGNPALHIDEEFYFLVGQRMLDGALPYVDIWDRKPPGLFFIYAVIASISRDVLAYQIAAWLSASFTAFTISRIVAGWTSWRGQFFAGLAYLGCITATGGFGGQSPVFYNLLMANAALLVVRSFSQMEAGKIPLKVYGAIALCGIALTIKQVVVVESIFFGFFCLLLYARKTKKIPWFALFSFAVIGIFPFAIFAISYMHYWEYFWEAMVLSNFNKASFPQHIIAQRASMMAFINIVPLLLGIIGAVMMKKSIERSFVTGWLVAALIGVALVPNFYWHYALPLFVPLAVMAAKLFDRPKSGPIYALVLVATGIYKGNVFDFAMHAEARQSMGKLAASAARHNPRGTMLVYEGPIYLMQMAGAKALSPVIFPGHLNEISERYSRGRDMREELHRILAQRPGVVVMTKYRLSDFQDPVVRKIVERHVTRNCRLVDQQVTSEGMSPMVVQVWGDCR